MINFIDDKGNVFNGCTPYIHWLEGGQSVNLQYIQKLYIIADSDTLMISEVDNSSEIKLIDTDLLRTTNELSQIIASSISVEGHEVGEFYVYQILFVCSSKSAAQITKDFKVTSGDDEDIITIGGDFYDLDETLQINLENRGMELPTSIHKAFLPSSLEEDYVDSILINRKFKELISNFIDVVDNRGSYRSLYNSLQWFEWGDSAHIIELWEDKMLFQKELSPLLESEYESLITTCRKTTYLALAVDKYKSTGVLDKEKNPVLEKIAREWSDDIISLKVSLLGIFYERYFLPIHLDLIKSTLEALVYTTSVKDINGTVGRWSHSFDDTGVIDITMDHTFVLGNIDGYSVGKDTVFGLQTVVEGNTYTKPIGVEPLETVETKATSYNDDDLIGVTFSQIVGGVGVVIPIKVRIEIPEGDGICRETLVVRSNIDNTSRQVTEQRLWMSDGGVVEFSFNLISTEEEDVSISLMLHSLSGHTWTAAANYKTIDTSGSYLKVCRVEHSDEWLDGNPYEMQYMQNNNIIYTQYLSADNKELYNELILVQNDNGISWTESPMITNDYWVLFRGPESDGEHKYTTLIGKKGGTVSGSVTNFLNKYCNGNGIIRSNIKRFDYIFVPQLHKYIDIESIELQKGDDGRNIMTEQDYVIKPTDMVCIIPQFKSTRMLDYEVVKWEFRNMSTLETIEYNVPISVPIIADNKYKLLSPGYWTVSMYYRVGSQMKVLTKNSAFRVV